MARPVVSESAENFYRLLGPLNRNDSDVNGWAGLALATGAAAMLQGVDIIAQDTPTHPGWGVVLDPDACPAEWLPWLGALYGASVIAGEPEQASRDRIRDLPAQRRGNPDTLIAAVKQTLTGTQSVRLLERPSGDAYRFSVVTRPAETPDADATVAAIVSQKPGGLVYTHVISDFALIDEGTRVIDDVTATINTATIPDVT